MKARISKDPKHAAELRELLEMVEKEVEKEPPMPFHREIVEHYAKAIKILKKYKHDGSAVSVLEDEHYRSIQELKDQKRIQCRIKLGKLKNDLETERDS